MLRSHSMRRFGVSRSPACISMETCRGRQAKLSRPATEQMFTCGSHVHVVVNGGHLAARAARRVLCSHFCLSSPQSSQVGSPPRFIRSLKDTGLLKTQ